jgi:hypothetical protein
MLTRSLGGLAVCVGVAAGATAQQPAARLATPQPKIAPAGYAAPRWQDAPAATPSTPAAQPVPTAPPPVLTPTAPTVPPAAVMAAPDVGYPTPGCAPYEGYVGDTGCGPAGQYWMTAEWLYWRASGQLVPPLVTAAPVGTPRTTAGALGNAATTVLFGGAEANQDTRVGFRFGTGMWFDASQSRGLEGDFFYLGQSRERFALASDGSTIIARPFTNALTGFPDTRLAAFPNVLRGSVWGEVTSNLIGGGLGFVRNVSCDPCGRFDFTYGFRYISLRDEVLVNEDLIALNDAGVPFGTGFRTTDRFRTGNHFYGIPLGFNWERRWSHWYLNVRSSIALGMMHNRTRIDGATTITTNGVPAAFPSGLLALPTNSGDFTENRFAVVPELGMRLGAQVTDRTRAFVGYNILYQSTVARAGEQIDLRVNPNQVAPPTALNGPALPAFNPQWTDFWVHGVSLGVEYRF